MEDVAVAPVVAAVAFEVAAVVEVAVAVAVFVGAVEVVAAFVEVAVVVFGVEDKLGPNIYFVNIFLLKQNKFFIKKTLESFCF